MNERIQAIATLLSLVNPAICAAIFASAVSGHPLGRKLLEATKAAIAILVVLSIAALAGIRLLHLFGISLDAFIVAGGGVLSWMGFRMLSQAPAAVESNGSQSLTPLIMFAASPGTITGVITISTAHSQLHLPVTALLAVAVATLVTWVAMLLVARFGGTANNGGFFRDTTTRFMGQIVLSMGVQFALTGYKQFWGST